MAKYRKIPVVIEAIQYDGTPDSAMNIIDWSGGLVAISNEQDRLDILTLEGVMKAAPGDWIIRGVADEYYPCKPDIFAKTYEAV